jgi:hypothetical protein
MLEIRTALGEFGAEGFVLVHGEAEAAPEVGVLDHIVVVGERRRRWVLRKEERLCW